MSVRGRVCSRYITVPFSHTFVGIYRLLSLSLSVEKKTLPNLFPLLNETGGKLYAPESYYYPPSFLGL